MIALPHTTAELCELRELDEATLDESARVFHGHSVRWGFVIF